MKRFEFPLARVRDFRRQQMEAEEGKLQRLHMERQQLDAESARLVQEDAAIRVSLMVTGSAESQELAAMDSYLRHLVDVRKRHGLKIDEWKGRAAKQQQAVVEARRRLRLMEKLEERRYSEWKHALDSEQENLSSELYLARWKKD